MTLPFEALIPITPRVTDIDYVAPVFDCESSSDYGDSDNSALEI